MYTIALPIGDVSKDGHGLSEIFYISSNEPISVLREADVLIEEKTGIKLKDICNDYEEDSIKNKTTLKLIKLGFPFFIENDLDLINGYIHPSPKAIARLWMFLLTKVNPNLKLSFITNPPVLHHFNGQIGYGVFSL